MNSIKKYVVSGSLTGTSTSTSTGTDTGTDTGTGTGPNLTWDNTEIIPAAEAVSRIRELRDSDGGDLLIMGSPTLARTLLSAGLVDELILMRMPVVLGGGKSVFPADGGKRPFRHVSTTTAKTGAEVSVYQAVMEK